MSLVGDRERDRAAATLQRHYLQGRLSLDELADRVHLVLRARSRADLRAAFSDLPATWRTAQELAAPVARTAARVATFLALAALWSFLSFLLLCVFVVAAIVGDPSATTTLLFLLLWVGISFGLWRVWRQGRLPSGTTKNY